MRIVYNGVAIDVLTLDEFSYDVVLDDSQTDVLYNRVRVLCSGMVNGQRDVREAAGPPISYTDFGVTEERQRGAARLRPDGMPEPPAASAVPPDQEVNRKVGAADPLSPSFLRTNPYKIPPLKEPAFAKDRRPVEEIVPGPANPILTMKLIEKRLTDPRGKLFVYAGTADAEDNVLLRSPLNWSDHCDAKNGPKPTHFSITSSFGDGVTFFVQFGVETYLNTKQKNQYGLFGDEDPLLSNRFSMVHALDEASWLTMRVQGTAVFDTGKLHKYAANPDSYRANLFLPIPWGFVRKNIVVEGEPDMSAVHYEFEDQQQPVHFPAGPYAQAAHIEAEHRQYILCDDAVLDGAIQSYEGYLNRRWLQESRAEQVAARQARNRTLWAKSAANYVPPTRPPGGTP